MDALIVNVTLAFFEGIGLILSPCILPILPIILAGSLTGSKTRPFGIIIGFILTFTIITLFSRAILAYAHIDALVLRNVSYALLILLGLIMLSSTLTAWFGRLTNKLLTVGGSLKKVNDNEGGFSSGLLFGALVGLIFTPCAGPILAAVIVSAISQQTTLHSLFTVFAFALGVSVPMFFIALFGRSLLTKVSFLNAYTDLIRKLLGLLIIASVFYLIFSENLAFAKQEKVTVHDVNELQNGLSKPYPAPQILGINGWINSPPLKLEKLRGKVVLIDFWTYSCINCIRTLPYIKDWYEKYADDGLVVIGVHSPEFAFEQDYENVKAAVEKFGITYPVALDNQFETWKNYHNQYWPAHYLINQNGDVVYTHFGEGEYATTENNIRFLLGIKDVSKPEVIKNIATLSQMTPEIYLGYDRSANFTDNLNTARDVSKNYEYHDEVPLHYWSLSGDWKIFADHVEAVNADSKLNLHYRAREVYAVMGKVDEPVEVTVITKNGRTNKFMVTHHDLYTLVPKSEEDEGMLEIRANKPGLQIYTFTFGG